MSRHNKRRTRKSNSPQRGRIQTSKGGIKSITIMCKYGSVSYIKSNELNLPWLIERTKDETSEQFFLKLAHAHEKIRKQLIKILGITKHDKYTQDQQLGDDGTWDKPKYFPERQIQHNV